METFRCSLVALALVACHHDKPAEPLPPLPRAAYAHYLDGKLAMYEKHYDVAVDALAEAAAAAPDQPMIVVELARAQAKSGAEAAARDTLTKARDRWPDRAEIWETLGELLTNTSPDEAARAYRKAIALAADDEPAYLGLAHLETERTRLDAAEHTLRDLVEHVPTSVDGHYRLAQRLAARNDLGGAIIQLRAVLEHDPDHIDGRIDLARALRRQGHLADAIVETRNAFDRSAQDADVAEELFWLLCEADDRQAALDLLTLLDDDHAEIPILALVARLERGLGRLVEARAVADRIAKRDADAGAIAIAEVELAAGDTAKAAATASTVGADSKAFSAARRVAAEAYLAVPPSRTMSTSPPPPRSRSPMREPSPMVARCSPSSPARRTRSRSSSRAPGSRIMSVPATPPWRSSMR
jgi:tetratricopeptide (TPR) repeat protein